MFHYMLFFDDKYPNYTVYGLEYILEVESSALYV
jgi:hypothetical protein